MRGLHERNEELLREALVDLERTRHREAQARRETESLLDGLKALGRAGSAERMFGDLLQILREILAFDDALVLTRDDDGCLTALAATTARFQPICWQPGDMLNRVLNGQAIAAFDVGAIPDWLQLPEVLRRGVTSALHAPLTSHGRVAILVCTHSGRGVFTKSHVETVKRFAPLVEQALVNAEAREASIREKELVHQREMALRESRLKSEFLSTISHELRTPMNAVLGFGQLLASECAGRLGSEHENYLIELMKAGHHLLDLIDGVLQIARIDSGRLALDITSVDLRDLLPECRRLSESRAEQHGVSLHDRVCEGPPAVVRADIYQLKQVLLQLIGNAVSYNRPGGSVHIALGPSGGGGLRLDIADTGPGLDETERLQVFEPFVRGSSTRDKVPGTGLGLTLSKRLIQAMGGEIGVDKRQGGGSVFWLQLPTGDGHGIP